MLMFDESTFRLPDNLTWHQLSRDLIARKYNTLSFQAKLYRVVANMRELISDQINIRQVVSVAQ